jgi:hypothetical protein
MLEFRCKLLQFLRATLEATLGFIGQRGTRTRETSTFTHSVSDGSSTHEDQSHDQIIVGIIVV